MESETKGGQSTGAEISQTDMLAKWAAEDKVRQEQHKNKHAGSVFIISGIQALPSRLHLGGLGRIFRIGR